MGQPSDIEGDAARALEALRRAAHFLAHYEAAQAALSPGVPPARSPLTALVEEGVDAADRVLGHLRAGSRGEWSVISGGTAPWSVLTERGTAAPARAPVVPRPAAGQGDPGE
ncbi:hypothetical protein [Catenuloplanes indicus]|uniref:Uncharacterized protein n=1 Tax=Catenuloplanes indicus TaxID=137267 RepID=A0AAE3W3T2_9ACTN|nr:hypothetical protein [Catenuloplanes indicus]MDQ0368757.1 hypothetical protein [Catenuloplanes indicus]